MCFLLSMGFCLPLFPSLMFPKGFADVCTSFLGHSPTTPFAHTSDQSVCSGLNTWHQMVHAPLVCSQTCTRFCTLGLNFSTTYGAGTFLTGLKLNFSGREIKQILPLPTICLQLTASSPALFCITKTNNNKQLEERFLDCFIFLPSMEIQMLLLGSIFLGGCVYIVKLVLPNQEQKVVRFGKRSLRWEALGMWQRRREVLLNSLWHQGHSLFPALPGPLCPG